MAKLELKGVRKSFQSLEVIHGINLTRRRRILHRVRRPLRVREIDPVADDCRA